MAAERVIPDRFRVSSLLARRLSERHVSVPAVLRSAGLPPHFHQQERIYVTTSELFAKYGALPQGADRNEKTNGDRSYWLGEMTPRGTGRMLEAIQRCADGTASSPAIASQKSCADMMRMMRAQQSGTRRLPHFLSVPVAHKTGDFPPVLANDVGVVFARSGPIVISFFTNSIEGPYSETEDRIGRVAQLIVGYFDGTQ